MKKLEDLTKVEYEVLKSSGALQQIYPNATGSFEDDCLKGGGQGFEKVENNDLIK